MRIDPTGGREILLHLHDGQIRAWDSSARFTAVIAGTQSGKTVFGPVWLWREIKENGPGDYMVVTPTFPLLELKALPAFRQVFKVNFNLGRYFGSPVRRFVFSAAGSRRLFGLDWDGDPTVVYFGHAMDPDSLESATAKAAWLDEPGQKKFKIGSWEAIQRRLSIHTGRALLTTTPYNLGWFKQQIYDRGMAGDPEIAVVNFTSIENPAFPREEYERQRRVLPGWKFRMFYQGLFERPAGLIYDSFDEKRCKIPAFAVPDGWDRLLGLDFGGSNLVGVFYALEPETGRLFLYRTYHAGGRTAREHVAKLLEGEPGIPLTVGGARSEGQWRDEFSAAGLPVREPPISDVELGINRVYGLHKENRIVVFDGLDRYLDQKMSYARQLDEAGEPTEEIEDKDAFHYMDAERYLLSWHVHDAGIGYSEIIEPEDPLENLVF